MPFPWTLARPLILVAPIMLAGCLNLPMGSDPVARPGGAVWTPLPADGDAVAETACRSAAEERGLQVLGVQDTSPTALPDGTLTGTNVMLRVQRGTQVYDQRCHFALETGIARIMAL